MMKWKVLLISFVLMVAAPLYGQSSATGNISAAGSTCATTNACLALPLTQDSATVVIQVSGTFSATIQFEQTLDGSTWVSASGVPQPSGAAVTSTTTTGIWRFVASGATVFRVRCSAYTSGPSTIVINASKGSASGSGGGGAGTITSVSGTTNQIGVANGTTTPVVSLTNPLVIPGQTTISAPSGTAVTLSLTGDSHSSDIQDWFLAGGGKGAWVDYLGGIHGTSGDFGAGLGQGCVSLYDPTGSLYVNHCGPSSNLAANYEVDDPAVPSAGFLYFDGFQTTSWSPAPASSANGLSTGGQVICSTTTLVCTISAATFVINGVQYASPQSDVTLVADGTNPRIDTFYVGCTLAAGVCDGTNVGIAGFIPGTPAGSPATPSVDPTIQLEVGFVTIAALATNPTVTNETIYEDDAGPAAEWTVTASGAGINVAGATGCYLASSKCIIGTAVTAGQYFKGVRGSGTVVPSSYNVLGFEVKSAATWPKAKCLNIAFYNGTTLVGNAVSFCNGSFAFNSSQTSTYQQIAIAASLFNATTAVNTVQFTAVGGGAAFSWTVDHILLQSGITPPNPGTGGTVTSIATTAPLAGGTITTSGTISITGAAGQVLAGASPAFTATPALGTDNSVAGTVTLANSGANAHTILSSGATTTNTIAGFTVVPTTGDLVSCTSASTTCTLTDSGVLAANVVTSSSGHDLYQHFEIPSANCVGGTAGSVWSFTTTLWTVACIAGTNNVGGALQAKPSDGTGVAQFLFKLPSDWDTAIQPKITIAYGSGANTTGTVIWTVSSACTKTDGSVTTDPAFNAESAFGTQTMAAASRMWAQSGQFTAMTSGNNCIAGSPVIIKLALTGTASSVINAFMATVTVPRTNTF